MCQFLSKPNSMYDNCYFLHFQDSLAIKLDCIKIERHSLFKLYIVLKAIAFFQRTLYFKDFPNNILQLYFRIFMCIIAEINLTNGFM